MGGDPLADAGYRVETHDLTRRIPETLDILESGGQTHSRSEVSPSILMSALGIRMPATRVSIHGFRGLAPTMDTEAPQTLGDIDGSVRVGEMGLGRFQLMAELGRGGMGRIL